MKGVTAPFQVPRGRGKKGAGEESLEDHETEVCSPSHLCVPKRQIYCARRGAEKIGARSSPCSTRRRLAIIAPQSLFRASNCPLWDLEPTPRSFGGFMKPTAAMAVKATWHVKLTRGDHARTAFTDYHNRVPKRGAIETLHVDGERVKLRIHVVHEQPRARSVSLGLFHCLATEVV